MPVIHVANDTFSLKHIIILLLSLYITHNILYKNYTIKFIINLIMSCKYSNSLGKPNEGIHSYRFLGVAIIDVIFTFIASAMISFAFKFNFLIVLFFLFILAIALHRIFCVNTTINKLIFGTV